MVLDLVAARLRVGQQLRLARPRRGVVLLPRDELALDLHHLVDLGLDRLGDLLGALLEPVEPLGGRLRLRLGVADAVDDPCVLRRRPLQELGPLEQVGEAVGLEHDRHDVRRVLLVHLHEPVGELHARLGQTPLQPRESQALTAQVLLDLGELGALGVEARLQPHLLGLQHRDVGLQAVDPAREGADLRGQHALAALVLLDLRAAALDLLLQALAARAERQYGPQGERHGRHQEQEAESSTHAAGHARRPPRRDSRTTPLLMERATNPAGCRAFPRMCDDIIPSAPTGLAVGLASVRYAVIRPRFAPVRLRFPRSTGWSPVDSASRNLPAIAALKKALIRVCHHSRTDAQTHFLRQGHRAAGPDGGDDVPARARLRRAHRRAARGRRERL